MIDKVLSELSHFSVDSRVRSVILTGGRSAKHLYERWHEVPEFDRYKQARFYFGDERCVPADHADSNFRMVLTAFSGSLHKIQYERIHGEAEMHTEEAMRYDAILPDMIDLALFSVGEDGHIASLFPYSSAMKSMMKAVYVSDSPKPPSGRITITPRVIQSAKNVIVMAAGKKKGRVLAQALKNPIDVNQLPVRLTIGRTWVLDKEALAAFFEHPPENHYKTKIVYA